MSTRPTVNPQWLLRRLQYHQPYPAEETIIQSRFRPGNTTFNNQNQIFLGDHTIDPRRAVSL